MQRRCLKVYMYVVSRVAHGHGGARGRGGGVAAETA
jgi:hypothetical protein